MEDILSFHFNASADNFSISVYVNAKRLMVIAIVQCYLLAKTMDGNDKMFDSENEATAESSSTLMGAKRVGQLALLKANENETT